MPPVVNNVMFTNPTLANPASGQTPTTTGVRDDLDDSATDFKNPRTMQWNVGVTRRIADWMTAEASYVGSRGDNLIRPTDINYPDPVRVVRLQTTRAGGVQSGAAVSVVRRHHVPRDHGALALSRPADQHEGRLRLDAAA